MILPGYFFFLCFRQTRGLRSFRICSVTFGIESSSRDAKKNFQTFRYQTIVMGQSKLLSQSSAII